LLGQILEIKINAKKVGGQNFNFFVEMRKVPEHVNYDQTFFH
jgi:hypothetical protein